MVKNRKLFDKFPPVKTNEWMDKIHTDLKGADFKKKLVWKTDEGFEVNPFYREDDISDLLYINTLPGEFPYLRGTKVKNNSWFVRQNIEVTDYSSANSKALCILMKGVDSLGFIIADPETVNENNFKTLLKDIHIEIIEINFLCNGKAKEILDVLIKITKERGLDPERIRGAVEADPIGRLLMNGTLCIPVEKGFDYLASLTELSSELPDFCSIHMNLANLTNSGADLVQQLAFGLSMGSEYIVQLTERDISARTAASKIRFSFGVGSSYFAEIARIRAARLLWSVVTRAYKPLNEEPVKMNIHCETSKWNKTVYDPYVNMLRTQTEAMSAILGGTDSLTVDPFDTVFKNPDEFSERIARNQQLILKEEAYFDKVVDPAAGSYYVENLTSLITESAWKLFIDIEDKGGFLECIKTGYIQKMISDSAAKRRNDVARRNRILLGTNQYPNKEESVSSLVDANRLFDKKPVESDLFADPIVPFRGSEAYDRIRIAVDKGDKRPVIFILPIGNQVMQKARSNFSSNFFGCAGYHVISNNGFDTIDEAVSPILKAEPDIIVICSSDEEYLGFAPDIYNRFKDLSIIVVAGNPSCSEDLRAIGLTDFIHVKSDVTETLEGFNTRLGIKL
jgi:methylmalonyl-CoA mutase